MLLYLILISACLQSNESPVSNSDAQSPAACDYVMNRLSPERIDALVARPQALLEAGDLDGARRLVDQMLTRTRAQHGDNSVEAADLLMAFGVVLHVEGEAREDEGAEVRALAGTYVKRSIPVYRAAFGANHPEVAVALNSHADVLRLAAPDDPPAAAEAALEEAYRIRLECLGPSHSETIGTILDLVEVRTAPGRVRQDPRLVEAAAAELERAAQLSLASDRETAAELPPEIHVRRARLFARYGRADEARRALEAVEEAVAGLDALDRCLMLAMAEEDVANLLATATDSDGRSFERSDFTACFEPGA